ncbi:tRNA (adenosine(37)-N6)-dimethylallyltransferase MiaA [candidate division WOR-3 bacterium]|nr:tRNA (adenosine(37)-N6)-dimethylallyltransferase MiaA [candidate division WOR-3 bacterium]
MKILAIVGPTAVGKTAIAVKLARLIQGEIISADSRQIYKHLDIGTAKPDARQRKRAKFHLIDFVEPGDDYSCGQFARDAGAKIEAITKGSKVPIVCGGTGLYIKALFHPLDELPRSGRETKKRLRTMLEEHGTGYLYKRLSVIDPQWARQIKPQDTQRILRGLEVYETTGKPLSKMLGKAKRRARFSPLYIGLNIPREILYARIDQRFDEMLKQGLVREAESLLARGLDPSSNALRTIGYKEIIDFLRGRSTLEQAAEKAKRRTRNYAKRQLTWFKKLPDIHWHNPQDPGIVQTIAEHFDRNRIGLP